MPREIPPLTPPLMSNRSTAAPASRRPDRVIAGSGRPRSSVVFRYRLSRTWRSTWPCSIALRMPYVSKPALIRASTPAVPEMTTMMGGGA